MRLRTRILLMGSLAYGCAPLAGMAEEVNRAGGFPALIPSWELSRGTPPDLAGPAPLEPVEEVKRLRLRLAMDMPLRTTEGGFKGSGFQGSPAVSPTLQADLRYNPHSSWFAGVTFYRYLMGDRQRPWNPDFTYTFGYDDWRPDTFSFTYSNYGGNRLFPDHTVPRGQLPERHTRFNQGQWSLGYKFALPEALRPLLLIDEKHQLGCSINANLTPRYTDLKSRSIQSGKRSASLGCRYSTPSNWYANVTFYYYPDRSQQQPWDPDFTYGFGYFDRHPGTISIQYNNYSGNRYPWHERSRGQGEPRNGSISISWSHAW